jgi:DNA helicase-2/ATP-dependent DNA helicase PcrA
MRSQSVSFNREQKQAVTHPGGPIRVLAVAGSGKTLVLTRRIVHLVNEHRVDPANILAITFARKAAQEIKDRLKAALDGRSKQVTAGTFHSVCFRILRRESYPSARLTVLDDDTQLELILEAGKKGNGGMDPVELGRAISLAKSELLSPAELAMRTGDDLHTQRIAKVYEFYERLKLRRHLLDFDDLIYHCYRLLATDEEVLSRYRSIYRHILVDEFQDSSRGMVEIVKLLGEPENNLWVAGDDDQCIHTYRGARAEYFISLDEHYRESLTTIEMSLNYRSTRTIIESANRLISHNRTRVAKRMKTRNPRGEEVEILSARDEEHEAKLVVERIRILGQAGFRLRDMAILGRCHHQMPPIEQALFLLDLPYSTPAGVMLYERTEIRRVLGTARVLAQGDAPKTLDDEELAVLVALHQDDGTPDPKSLPPADLIYLSRIITKKTKDLSTDAEERSLSETYLDVLESLASTFDSLDHLLKHVENARGLSVQAGRNRVTLSTIHQAKGLEFPVVFIVGVEEGILPHHNSLEKGGAAIEEERRLMYVAVTRAMKKLVVTYCERRNGKEVMPSRFIAEMRS